MRHEEMDAKKPASTYGVDSLVAVKLRNWFSREAKVEMPVFEILQAPSLAALAARVVHRKVFAHKPGGLLATVGVHNKEGLGGMSPHSSC